MHINKHMLCVLAVALSVSIDIKSLSDNPFWPIFGFPIFDCNIRIPEVDSNFTIQLFTLSAHQGWDISSRETTIPMRNGNLDLHQLSRATQILHEPDPMPTAWQGYGTIPIYTVGKLQGQGIMLEWHQKVYEDIVAFGIQWYFLGLGNTQRFRVADGSERENIDSVNLLLGPGDRDKLDQVRRDYFKQFGIKETTFQGYGMGDLDAYLQIGKRFDHEFKVRKLKIGGRIGIVAPTGHARDQDISGSIPFGGDGFWGGYLSGFATAEIKEDFKLGCVLQVSKRFGGVQTRRVSVAGEPSIFGATLAPVYVNPGVMVLISPFFLIDNLREGLGLGMTYTVSKHQRDKMEDRRSEALKRDYSLHLDEMSRLTKWSSSYVTLMAQYDFGASKAQRFFDPIVSIRWDVPVEWMGTRQIVKTHKVAVGFDIVF